MIAVFQSAQKQISQSVSHQWSEDSILQLAELMKRLKNFANLVAMHCLNQRTWINPMTWEISSTRRVQLTLTMISMSGKVSGSGHGDQRMTSKFFDHYLGSFVLIHSTDPQSRPVVIHTYRPSFPTFKISQNKTIFKWEQGSLLIICGSGPGDQWWSLNYGLAELIIYGSNFGDPRGRPTITACCDHYCRTCCLSVSLLAGLWVWPSGSFMTSLSC